MDVIAALVFHNNKTLLHVRPVITAEHKITQCLAANQTAYLQKEADDECDNKREDDGHGREGARRQRIADLAEHQQFADVAEFYPVMTVP